MGQRSALSPQQVESLVRLVDRASTREKVPVLSTFTPTAATALQGPSWLERRRTDAAERFAARPLPTEKDEVWRYSRIDELDLDRFHPVSGPGEGRGESLDPQTMERVRSLVERIGPRSALIVSHNGGLASLETSPAADGACSLGLLSDHPEGGHLLGAVASDPGDFVLLNEAFALDSSPSCDCTMPSATYACALAGLPHRPPLHFSRASRIFFRASPRLPG